ncbi:MAG: polysaccharide deacetylase family protein [Bacillota bacterium]
MHFIIIGKAHLKWLVPVFIIAGFLIARLFFPAEPVYKDRAYWEKTGSIVWDVAIKDKMIALTFDDGPSPTFTGPVLDLLGKYHAKATFFTIGAQAEKFPAMIRRMIQEGHEIGNHTHLHQEIPGMSENELTSDLIRSHRVIQRIAGVNMKLFRPTSGFYNNTVVKVAHAMNYLVVIWTWGQDSRDWTPISGKAIAQKIIRSIKPGYIILFHDQGGNRRNTIEALEIILPSLQARGFQCVTVSTLITRARRRHSSQASSAVK